MRIVCHDMSLSKVSPDRSMTNLCADICDHTYYSHMNSFVPHLWASIQRPPADIINPLPVVNL